MLGLLGVSWIRSRAVGAPMSKVAGFALFLFITPAVFGLLPGHMHWLGAIPVEGVVGRLLVDGMTALLNYPGTCVLVATLLLIAVLLSTAFSFGNLRHWLAVRFAFVYAWRDRWKNWQLRRRKKSAARSADRTIRAQQKAAVPRNTAARAPRNDAAPAQPRTSWLSRVLHRPERVEDEDVPASRRSAFAETAAPASPEDAAYLEEPAPKPSLWTQIPRATVPDPEPEPQPTARANAIDRHRWEEPAPEDVGEDDDIESISIGERADADAHPVTLAPRAVSGFRLPPSTLLHRSDESQIVREDDLRESGPRPGGEMRGVRRTRPGGADQSRPGGHHLRIPPRSRSQVQPRDRPGRGSMPGDARGEHPDRAHGGKEHRGHPGAESRPRNHLAARRDRSGELHPDQVQADRWPWAKTSMDAL